MNKSRIAIRRTGLVTAVGLTSEQSCAAFRAKVTNPTETRYIDSAGEWIVAHQVPLEQPWRGLVRLVKMAAMAIRQVLQDVSEVQIERLPLLLCVAEVERPGRTAGLERLLPLIQAEIGSRFAENSAVIAQGRVAVAVAIERARSLISEGRTDQVLVAATDSLLSWPTLGHFERLSRLLTSHNSNGFMPGEASGALLLGAPTGGRAEVICAGIGFGLEKATVDGEAPLRADGLTQAFRSMLADAGCQMHDIDFRITDISGEQYYFKEAALALSRTLRSRKSEFDIWHPAECTGEVGAVSGATMISAAVAAWKNQYAEGRRAVAHMANDAGQRAALLLQAGP